MASNWIILTPKLKAGVNLINSVEPSKFRLLLNRIISYVQQENGKIGTSMFTSDEETKLEKSLGLELKDVQLVIDCLSLILQQAAFHLVKPDLMQSKLVESLLMEQERTALLVSLWSVHAGSIVENLKCRSVVPYQLADVSWLLMVETSSESKRKRDPTALLELSLSCDENEGNTKVQLGMQHKDLVGLYQKLEHIQLQLDNLK